MYDFELLNSILDTREVGRTFLQFDSLQCAVKKARSISAQSPNGMVILAEEQWDSKGRNKDLWYSPKGGLYLSIIFKNNGDRDLANVLNLAAAAAVHDVLGSIDIDTELKLPNDLYYDDKKLGSILVEKSSQGREVSYIVGIRVNLDIENDDLASNIDKGISVSHIKGEEISREKFVSDILNDLERKYLKFIEEEDRGLFQPWDRMFERYDNLMEIRKKGNKRWKKVEVSGFDCDGCLVYSDCTSCGNIVDMNKQEVRMIEEHNIDEDR
ncbi:BirA family transcriptional regulator, biotin operon repressor / biotin-[acetyl-CoA-carboxylase] ligase [Dethiosulfatibacter aminovorans DSM 17477]|uniref:BirA family transcriptional regulator, biotin operon repressor / biotin-[acetyl-CoA-carboxylase] ligase n=1 Tax=Dethiosulfatibacter aminovorans DSM 17477 TaxID=1121476 RepID=A0A1M6MYL6_9FIRM|nr:biotin--[acetyl-CoA-carboxylase] ligase [Dethiosulfatibacter aminovorans]SHJ88514.1 BirA family transcriptional regulator, biotin operon repressor / biotin-[acetyl-CoA-carboxylase] ligase [Dethiosulfatibacter aminovorans DSM 17477]